MNTLETKSARPLVTNWDQINWQEINEYVEKLQQRIYHAESVGDKRKVRDLQRMLMNSEAALLVSIRRVTQLNRGKRTAGVDGYKALTPKDRLELYMKMKNMSLSLHQPKPAYRIYIEKKNGKLRPLGIPTILDRVYQNVARLALEPQWEARFNPTSYGFRPKRGCHDAAERIFNTMKGKNKKVWIFEGDFKGCFDTLNHDYIMQQLKEFPETELIGRWLKAGFVDNKVFNETEEGSPQGGIISPLLANIALHGMEQELGINYTLVHHGKKTSYENHTSYTMCIYADDFVILCETKQEAENPYTILGNYLRDRGLTLSEEKTKITHISDGFDFLGFNIRRYTTHTGAKLLIKPSKSSIRSFKTKVADIVESSYGNNVQTLINRLNPVIIGTANYWCRTVAKEIFSAMDNYVWKKIYRFLRRSHPKKGWKWIKAQHFKPDKTGQSRNKWILTDPNTGNQLKKMAWTPIVRHQQIKYNYSPYDVTLKGYFAKRDQREFDLNNVAYRQKLAKKQNYVCPMCGMSIVNFKEGLEPHHKHPAIQGGTGAYKNLQLVHNSCHIDYHEAFPAKGEIPTPVQIAQYYKVIKGKRLAGVL